MKGSRTRPRSSSTTEIFLELSHALSLDAAEERALLDLPSSTLAQLRAAPSSAFQLGGPKLERRLDYAVPILKRMLASIAS